MYISAPKMYMMSAKRWTIATARQQLPALIASAAREPQRVYRRRELVAMVMGPDAADAAARAQPPLADELAELQRLCVEEDYELPVARRQNRRSPSGPLSAAASPRQRAPKAR